MDTNTVESDVPAEKPFSLAHHVIYLLEKNGIINPQEWLKGLNPEALATDDVNVQRFHINRCWTSIFLSLPTTDEILSTRNARGCLMNGQCTLEDWSRLFDSEVIPCAIKTGLLKKIA
jgi:hypothetical protein